MRQTGVFRSFDGVKIAYYVTGNKKGMPIVLSNGLGGNVAAWMPFIEALKDKYFFITWDYRGLYKSGIPEDEHTMAVPCHVRDLEMLLGKLHIHKALFIGWSMGVQVNFEFYKTHPGMFYGIAVLSGAAGHPFETTRIISGDTLKIMIMLIRHLGPIASGLVRFVTKRSYFFDLLKLFGVVAQPCSKKVFMDIVKDIRDIDFGLYFTGLVYLGEHTAEDVLPDVKCPTLIVVGEKDLFTPLPVARKIHEAIKHSRLFVLPEATHYAMAEYPAEITKQIVKFINKHRIDGQKPVAVPLADNRPGVSSQQ
jgi:pimeloyl-ACP methyl ester carboxylesterase